MRRGGRGVQYPTFPDRSANHHRAYNQTPYRGGDMQCEQDVYGQSWPA